MGTLLKVLTVIILVLSIFALVMGTANFHKREVLIGRTHQLEQKIIQLSKTIEQKPPVFDEVLERVERDMDVVSDRPVETPSQSTFWENYDESLEGSSTQMYVLDDANSKMLLGRYFRLDAEGEIMKDANNRPITSGEGTMESVLQPLVERAMEQLNQLNRTRAQLTKVRKELESVIQLLNEEKQNHRASKREIATLNTQIGELNAKITKFEADIARLDREKAELNDQIVELKDQVNKKDEQIVSLDNQINILKEQLAMVQTSTTGGGGTETQNRVVSNTLSAGVKGTIAHVNRELSFVIVKLNEETVKEITAGGFAPVEMMVHRKSNQDETIVTRIRIANPPNKERLVIAENLFGWEQTPVNVGDEVVY